MPARTEHSARHLHYIPRVTQSIATHLPLPMYYDWQFRSSHTYDRLYHTSMPRQYVQATTGVGASYYVDGTLATGVYFYTDMLPTYDMDRGDNHSAYVHGAQRRHLIEGSPLRILRCAN